MGGYLQQPENTRNTDQSALLRTFAKPSRPLSEPKSDAQSDCRLAILIAVAGIAGYVPARRASLIDPIAALHAE
jgi:hypothetical protein